MASHFHCYAVNRGRKLIQEKTLNASEQCPEVLNEKFQSLHFVILFAVFQKYFSGHKNILLIQEFIPFLNYLCWFC